MRARPAPGKAQSARVRARVYQSTPAVRWPSEAEQTLDALRAGLIDALVIPHGPHDSIYALRTFDELEQANRQLRESQERLLMLLNEHERLIQDLHDGCIQSIYAVGLTLEDCRGLIRQDPAQAAQKVAQAEARLNLVIQELRAFISRTKPDTRADLSREITKIVEGLGAHAPRFRIDIDQRVAKALPRDHATQLLQIAREGISNIVRHANAESGRVSLRQRGPRHVRLEIEDDGEGFDLKADRREGLGLHHIAARVQKLGGRLRLRSRPSKGCRIVVEIAT